MYIDTHAHIYLTEFDADREGMLARASEAGVTKIYMPNVDSGSIPALLETERTHPDQCIAMMGLHPCSVKDDFETQLSLVEQWLSRRKFSAVGEIGTDLYWDKTFWVQQQEAFRRQLGWAKNCQLPVVIHCRESIDETIQLVEPWAGKVGGIFHCFGGTLTQAQKIIDMGFLLGIGGVATFKNGGLDKVLPDIPLESIVLETDSPYLAPVPYRGKRNEPSYIPLVAHRIATLKNISIEEVGRVTTANAIRIFGQ